MLSAGETLVNETDTVPVLMELRFLLTLSWGTTKTCPSVWVSAVPQAAG